MKGGHRYIHSFIYSLLTNLSGRDFLGWKESDEPILGDDSPYWVAPIDSAFLACPLAQPHIQAPLLLPFGGLLTTMSDTLVHDFGVVCLIPPQGSAPRTR